MMPYTSKDILGESGLLKQAVPTFVPRAPQQEMAEAVERAIELNTELIVEAGTGTGKTFAYLIPALLSDKKVIISTGTKNLQDQLFFKDIPLIQRVLSYREKIVLLKGRANYLCLNRLQTHRTDGRLPTRQLVSELQDVVEWSAMTREGDVAELKSLPEDSPIWPYVTSTADNCLNQDCEFIEECYVAKARKKALAANVVIVNHHLFFADMALQEDKLGELLPGADVVIFDEAHQLPEIASQFFSTVLSSRQLTELAKDTDMEIVKHAKDMQVVRDSCLELQDSVVLLRKAFGVELKKYVWPDVPHVELQEAIDNVKLRLSELEENLKTTIVRAKSLESCWRRAQELMTTFSLVTGKSPDHHVRWYETYTQSFTLHLTPLMLAEYFKSYLNQAKRSWIFTSATLSVKNDFKLFKETLGLNNAMQLQLNSPFDYPKQAILYVPRGMPDPRTANYTQSLMEAVIPVLEVTQGKAFLLFTSYRAMDIAAEYLKHKIPYPILIQGTAPKRDIIEQFKTLGNAVLVATSSFWYGVDVPGDALSCVVIDKLPFTAPDDPILQGKMNLLRKQGINPFFAIQLPQAVIALKQGAGRLIRDQNDRGVLVIGDPRLVGSSYGEIFLRSLPNMRRTRDLQQIQDFYADTASV